MTTFHQRIFFFGVLFGTLALAFFVLEPFIIPLFLGVIFAVILNPFYLSLVRATRGLESTSALITVLATIAIIMLSATFLGARLILEAQQFFGGNGGITRGNIEELFDTFATAASRYFPDADAQIEQISGNFSLYARQGLTWITEHIGSALGSLSSAALSLFVFLVSLFYLLRDGERLRAKVMELSPLSNDDDAAVLSRLRLAIDSVVKGQLSIALIQSILTAAGFALFGVPNPILWGMVTFFAALVPSVGTALVIAPATLYLFLTGDIAQGVGLALWGVAAVGLIDNILAPRLIGRGMRLHPLLILLSVLGGIALFGAAGIFLGPLSLALLFALLSLNKYLLDGSQIV